jgi:hypothetical protein
MSEARGDETSADANKRVSLRGLADTIKQPRVVAALWVIAILHLGSFFARLPAREKRADFSVYYTASRALRIGVNPYTTDLTALSKRLELNLGQQTRIAETPSFLLAFEPLTLLSPARSYWVWFTLSLAALCASLVLLLRRVGSGALALGALLLLYPPLIDQFMFAQSQLIILLLLSLMLCFLEAGNDAGAGLTLGIAGALRAYPLAIFGYLALMRRWRALFFTLATLAVVGFATVMLLGWRMCIDFTSGARFTLRYLSAGLPKNISINGFISHFFWNIFGPKLGHNLHLVRYLTIAACEVVIVGFSIYATVQSSDSRAFSLWIATAIMLSPIAWLHYLVLMFILFAEIAAAANQGECSRRAMWAAVAGFISIALVNAVMHLTSNFSRTFFWLGQLYFVPLLLVYLSAYWLATDPLPLARPRLADASPSVQGALRA